MFSFAEAVALEHQPAFLEDGSAQQETIVILDTTVGRICQVLNWYTVGNFGTCRQKNEPVVCRVNFLLRDARISGENS